MENLNAILGYTANPELKRKILREAAETGQTVEAIALRYRMPEMYIIDRGDKIPERMYPGDVVIKCGNQSKIK